MEILAHERTERYIQNENEFSKSANFNQIKPFFDGDSLSERMNKIREGIIYIREYWNHYDEFTNAVQNYITQNVEDTEAKVMMEEVLKSKKDWAKSREDVDSGFKAIRLYTSVKGYNEIFSLVNRVFRDDASTTQQELIIIAVFVIELINIDLFNYCLSHDRFNNFTGVVYRGMALKESDYGAFKALRNKEISGRYIAIPLCLMSTSTSLKIANSFIKRIMRGRVDHKPLLMKIHVIELEKEYLEHYRRRFPTSVVSTICAVDIKDLSLMSHEKEVILRGPFFQVLDFYDGEVIENQTCKVLEMVMLNTNRDHISTMQLGQDSALARQLFGNMVAATRCKFAIKYYEDKGLHRDVEEYKKLLTEKLDKLKELMKN
ncbi:uncharacterized protein LOC116296517 [Actinia tenebrosa]|uniref:Uncharacterized protein LOC116296517 n=1 Tax=Actinia tenebrosa TaxID=6105 RepID=A0A6P8HYD8_ACTTE|nr:uncharacterized protein LOC116296517 [Actinia tenebrosa]